MQHKDSYSNIPTIWRLVRKFQDSTGSRMPLERVTCLSHKMSRSHRIPDTVNNVMTYADLHGNSLSASSKAAVNPSTAKRIRIVPGMSRRPYLLFALWLSAVVVAQRLVCPWRGKPFGMARIDIRKAMAAIGTLSLKRSVEFPAMCLVLFGRVLTYLMIKIHLQVVLAAIAPPTIGPTRRAKALTMAMFAAICAYFSDGTSSIIMTWHKAKEPPPPMPWKARRMILSNVSLLPWFPHIIGRSYSCVKVWAAAQAAENMMKIAVDSKNIDFRPKMSLNLAKMTMTATAGCKSLLDSGIELH